MDKEQSSQQILIAQLDTHTDTHTHTPQSIPCIICEKNSKWIKNLNIKHKTIKLIKENNKRKYFYPKLGKDLLEHESTKYKIF